MGHYSNSSINQRGRCLERNWYIYYPKGMQVIRSHGFDNIGLNKFHMPKVKIVSCFLAALLTCCMILCHTFWGIMFYHGLDQKNYSFPAVVIIAHMLVSCLVSSLVLNKDVTPDYIYILLVMPPPLGARGIMFSGCPSVRPSEAWNTLFWPVHGSVGPSDQPWPFCGMSVPPSVRPERFPGICRRTHGGNGLKFYMLMYLDHLQNWLVYGHSLLIFLILALFWLSETGQT